MHSMYVCACACQHACMHVHIAYTHTRRRNGAADAYARGHLQLFPGVSRECACWTAAPVASCVASGLLGLSLVPHQEPRYGSPRCLY